VAQLKKMLFKRVKKKVAAAQHSNLNCPTPPDLLACSATVYRHSTSTMVMVSDHKY